jgi:WD40 repeat protein
MTQKTLISMERDRFRNQLKCQDSAAPIPDLAHCLISSDSMESVTSCYSWPIYRDHHVEAWPNHLKIESMKTHCVCDSALSAVISFAIHDTTIEACGADDGTVRLIDFEKSTMSPPILHSSYIASLAFDQSSHTLIAGTGDGQLYMHGIASSGSPGHIHCHSSPIWTIDVLDQSLLTASMDHTSKIVDIESRKVKQTLKGFHSDSVNVARFWSSHTVLTGSADKSVCLWDMRSGHKVSSWYNLPSNSPIVDIADLGHGLFACASMHGQIAVCDKEKVCRAFQLPSGITHIEALASNLVAAACEDGTVQFLDINTDQIDSLGIAHAGSVLSICRRTESSICATTNTGTVHVIHYS